MKQLRWAKLASFVAGGGLSIVFAAGGPRWTAAGAVVAALAGAATQLLPNPATAVQADAPVVDSSGKAIGINVSTTSTIPISAEKGS